MKDTLFNKNFYTSLLSFVGIILLSLALVYAIEKYGGIGEEIGNEEYVGDQCPEGESC